MKQLKKMPILNSDEEAEEWLASVDLSEYDFSEFKRVNFVLEEDEILSINLPKSSIEAIRNKAKKRGVTQDIYIQELIAKDLITG